MNSLNAIFFLSSVVFSTISTTVIYDPASCGIVTGAVLQDINSDNLGDLPIAGVAIALYTDSNANGILDGSEGDAVVMIDPDGDGVFDIPANTTTNASGDFSFEGVPVGQYIIIQEQPTIYISQVEYDGGDDMDHPDNGEENSIPVIVDNLEVDSGNDFIEKRPLFDILIYTVPGTLSDLFDIVAMGSSSGSFSFPVNPISSGVSTGLDTGYVGETVDVMLTNADNNATLQNYSIIYEVKTDFGVLIERGSTEDESIQVINNSKDAIFSFTVPESDFNLKILIVKQGRIVFIKETIPQGDTTDFTINKVVGGTGLPASFNLDGEAVDGSDVDDYVNQVEFQLSGGEQGAYTLQEQSTEGWALNDISCVTIAGDLAEIIDISNSSLVMDIQNGDKCICTFTNIKDGAISGTVNNEGIGLPGVFVRLQDSDGLIVNSVVTSDGLTDADGDGIDDTVGSYYFENVAPGDYNILEEQPDGFDDLSEVDGGDDSDKIDNGITNNIPSKVLPGELDSGNDFTEQSTVLAVELGAFQVRTNGCNHSISLTTKSELNNEKIEVLHSFDGSNWNPIQSFLGAGTTDDHRSLLYNWKGNSSVSFFRLKFTDTNGEVSFSDIIRSAGNCSIARISVHPNPLTNDLRIKLEEGYSDDITIHLVDQMGKLVISENIFKVPQDQVITVDVSALTPGMYFLKVKDRNTSEVVTKRVVKVGDRF